MRRPATGSGETPGSCLGGDIDRALGVLAGYIARGGCDAALPIFARLERESAALDDVAAVMARARARASQGVQKS